MGSHAPSCRICSTQNGRLTPLRVIPCSPHFRWGIHYYSLIMIIGLWSRTLSAWSWFSIRVERVGVACSGLGTRAVRTCSWSVTAACRTDSLRATSSRTNSRRTTSTRTTSWPEFVEQLLGEQLLANNWTRRTNFRRTTSHKRLARTAKTNLEPLLSECLLLHLCVLARAHHRKGSLHILCRERVLLRIINILRLSGLVYPPTKSSARGMQMQGYFTVSYIESQRVQIWITMSQRHINKQRHTRTPCTTHTLDVRTASCRNRGDWI